MMNKKTLVTPTSELFSNLCILCFTYLLHVLVLFITIFREVTPKFLYIIQQ